MPYEQPNGTLVQEAIVGLGRTGLVIHHHGNALKIPRVYRDPYASSDEKEIEDIVIEQNCAFLENEKEVYRRLGDYEGIVDIISISEEGIEMAYMKNDSLFQYLQSQKPPCDLAVRWILKLAKAIRYAHSKCVIIADIASKNVLLDENMSVQFCDFSDSAVLPLGSDISQVLHYGLSVKTDIFQFGSLMYEILTTDRFGYDLLVNKYVDAQRAQFGDQDLQASAVWPRLEDLPDIKQIALGHILLKCWTGVYQRMEEVCKALKTAAYAKTG